MVKQQDLDELLDIKGAAAYKGMPLQTFHWYVRDGRGPEAYTLHGRSYFLPDDLDRWDAASIRHTAGRKKR